MLQSCSLRPAGVRASRPQRTQTRAAGKTLDVPTASTPPPPAPKVRAALSPAAPLLPSRIICRLWETGVCLWQSRSAGWPLWHCPPVAAATAALLPARMRGLSTGGHPPQLAWCTRLSIVLLACFWCWRGCAAAASSPAAPALGRLAAAAPNRRCARAPALTPWLACRARTSWRRCARCPRWWRTRERSRPCASSSPWTPPQTPGAEELAAEGGTSGWWWKLLPPPASEHSSQQPSRHRSGSTRPAEPRRRPRSAAAQPGAQGDARPGLCPLSG